jgi:hypothetical protein
MHFIQFWAINVQMQKSNKKWDMQIFACLIRFIHCFRFCWLELSLQWNSVFCFLSVSIILRDQREKLTYYESQSNERNNVCQSNNTQILFAYPILQNDCQINVLFVINYLIVLQIIKTYDLHRISFQKRSLFVVDCYSSLSVQIAS